MRVRDLDGDKFAEHMRTRRGESPKATQVVTDCGRSATGEGDWMVWVTVADTHPWSGEEPDECSDGGRLTVDDLLDSGESAEACDARGGWMINVFVRSEERACQLLSTLCEAAEAAAKPRQEGVVTSSR